MLKGLIFDLDGVLTDSAQLHLEAWYQIAEQLGIVLPPEAADALRGRSRMASLEWLLTYGHQENHYSCADKQALAAKKNTLYLARVKEMTPDAILPGIAELLAQAKRHGMKLAVASASRNAPQILMQLHLLNDFDAIVDPATLRHGKPDPEIYLKAQHLLGLKSNEVISFEDAIVGIAAIKAAHQFAVGIGQRTTLMQADYVVAQTHDLKWSDLELRFQQSQRDIKESRET